MGNCAGEFVAEASDKEQDAFQVPELSTRHQQCQIEQHKHDPILRLILFLSDMVLPLEDAAITAFRGFLLIFGYFYEIYLLHRI